MVRECPAQRFDNEFHNWPELWRALTGLVEIFKVTHAVARKGFWIRMGHLQGLQVNEIMKILLQLWISCKVQLGLHKTVMHVYICGQFGWSRNCCSLGPLAFADNKVTSTAKSHTIRRYVVISFIIMFVKPIFVDMAVFNVRSRMVEGMNLSM